MINIAITFISSRADSEERIGRERGRHDFLFPSLEALSLISTAVVHLFSLSLFLSLEPSPFLSLENPSPRPFLSLTSRIASRMR